MTYDTKWIYGYMYVSIYIYIVYIYIIFIGHFSDIGMLPVKE